MSATVFRLVFNVPESHLAACKAAIFAAGAGRYHPESLYGDCCWTTPGTGQFRPLAGANPYLGSIGKVEYVPEVRVEVPCYGEETVRDAIVALRIAHPYEEPSFQVFKVEEFKV